VAEKLDKYMRFRAANEGVGYEFDPAFYQTAMWLGADKFFGVAVKGRAHCCGSGERDRSHQR
jgi:hypothetical protein